ncbi:serine hydrolase domain-containing protein [Pedobacter terrae]|uniref:serine hydrolase domain-containing protein n=1 Tax=Pedobacter terrae TaxID=405671 RepID=UPI002FF6FADA
MYKQIFTFIASLVILNSSAQITLLEEKLDHLSKQLIADKQCGVGLSSTTADYAKFLQMLLNKGIYNGKKLLSAKTIELMTTNQLSKSVITQGDPDFRYGLGFWLVTEKNKFIHSASVGAFFWGGAFNTHYWAADPKEDIIGLVFTQEYLPASYWDLGTLYKNVIYSSF